MKIVVCVKQVPATESKIKAGPGGADIDRTHLGYVVNPYCEFGLEEALRIREKAGTGTVTAVSLGPARVGEALRTCLAMGADEAIHLRDDAFEGGDSWSTALALAALLKRQNIDLALFGKQAVDDDQGAVGIAVAELLDLPHVGVIQKLQIDWERRTAVADRQIEGGLEVVETSLPAVFTCQKGLNEPRYPSLPGIMKAKKAPLHEIDLKGLNLEAESVGAAGSRTRLRRLMPPPARAEARVLQGSPAEAVRELLRLLREEAKIL